MPFRSGVHLADLTARQLEVLTLVAVGLTDREISEALFITVRTTGAHVSAILARLGVRNRTAAARVLLERSSSAVHA